MTNATADSLIPQSVYAKNLRPLLPKEAFEPDPSKLLILLINLAILLVGWAIAAQLKHWPIYLLWLYLPFALVMANSVIVLLFVGHDLMHGSVIRNRRLAYIITLFSQAVLWMPPTLWKHVHNRVHHSKTNSLEDPDRNYLYQQPNAFGKWMQNAWTPSSEVSIPGFTLGMMGAWGVYGLRHLVAVLFFSQKDCNHVTAQFKINAKDRRAIVAEFSLIVLLHLALLSYLQFNPIALLLGYFLPIGLGYAGLIFYIYTNHLFRPMTEVNDPLINSVSLHVPKLFDVIHFNFSYHAEHHIFPGLNSDYYPLLRECIAELYPERMGYTVTAQAAWQSLFSTPRHYFDENTLTDWTGTKRVPCILPTVLPTPAPQNNSDLSTESAAPAG
ncbi:MAG: fatty acid desaturase [Phormidesmis sp.]